MKQVDIVIPVLNEEITLKPQISTLIAFCETEIKDVAYSIVIADNGSTDKTEVIAKQLSENNDNVRYLKVSKKGVGLALKEAWKTSSADFVGYMDLDFATSLSHLPEAIKKINSNDVDIVYGSRLHKESKVIGRTVKREITSRAFNTIIRLYFSSNISDGMCGFKFLKSSIVSDLIQHGARSDGWFFCTEILLVAERLGLRSFELPVTWTDDPNSKVNIKNLTIEYLKAMRTLKRLPEFHNA